MNNPKSGLLGNYLLDALPSSEAAQILRHGSEVHLRAGELIGKPGEAITRVYFPTGAVVSSLRRLAGTPGIEVAGIGREGLVGLGPSWGMSRLGEHELLQVEVSGEAIELDASVFVAMLAERRVLFRLVRNYTGAFFNEISQQAACSAVHSIEQRCARWLLSTQDRVGEPAFQLTQELLAQLLGVRRPSVTVVALSMQQGGLIRYHRGALEIVDRSALENAACECYSIVHNFLFQPAI